MREFEEQWREQYPDVVKKVEGYASDDAADSESDAEFLARM